MRHVPLMAILAAAIALRIWGIGFGLPHTLIRPDEDAVFNVALRFFSRELNPDFFHWPSLFMYAVAAVFVVYFNIGRSAGWFSLEKSFVAVAVREPAPLYLIARGMSAAAGVMTVWTVHRIALRLFDRATAVIAAILLATCALHVRDSHFGVTDVAATWLITLAFLWTAKFARSGRRRDAVVSALFVGLAASTKYNAAFAALPGVWALTQMGGTAPRRGIDRVRTLALCAAVAAVAFLAGTPYALIDSRAFLTALDEVGAHLRGGHMILGGPAWRVHLGSSLRYGAGWPLVVSGLAGMALYVRRDWRSGVMLAIFPVAYFAVIGAGQTAFARYIIPVLPFLCLGAAYFVMEAARAIVRVGSRPALASAIASVLTAMVAAPSALSAIATDRLLSRTDNRLLAAEWIRGTWPGGTTLYQSGSIYGHVQMPTADPEGAARYPQLQFDEAAGVFRDSSGAAVMPPDVVVVQESRLGYSTTPPAIHRLLATEYDPRQTFVAVDSADQRLAYDMDDAFFLPLAGFDAVVRPGPNVSIYVRAAGPSAAATPR